MSNHSVIEHRANYHFLKVEEDYLAICSRGEHSPHCKALILAILEHWTNSKRERDEDEYIHLTMPQWIQSTYMLYERNAITDCIQELLKEKLIERREIVRYGQKTFEYKLLVGAVNEQIKALPQKEPKEVFPRLNAYLSYKENAKKRAQARKKQVREKSPTQHVQVREKSHEVGDKSPEVREKPTQHRLYTKIANQDSHRSNSANTLQPPVPQKPILTPSGEHIIDLFEKYKKRKATRSESTIQAANGLSEVVEQDQDLLDVLKEIDQDDFINKRSVRTDLDFVYRKYDGFFDVVCRKRSLPAKNVSGLSNKSTTNQQNIDRLAKMMAENAAKSS